MSTLRWLHLFAAVALSLTVISYLLVILR